MGKNIIYFIAILIACSTLLIGCSSANAEEAAPILTIKDIQYDPLSFTGEITINGVSVGVYPRNSSIFILTDTEELIACKNMSCGAFQLPALYLGDIDPIPEVADEVNITGSWMEYEEDGQTITLFGVTKIEVKRNIMNLLT